jgi:WD40 repeat protein
MPALQSFFKTKSKNDTWNEKELAKVLKQSDTGSDVKPKADKAGKPPSSSSRNAKEKGPSSKSSTEGRSREEKASTKDKERKEKRDKPPSGTGSKASPFSNTVPGSTKDKTSTKERSSTKEKTSTKERSSSKERASTKEKAVVSSDKEKVSSKGKTPSTEKVPSKEGRDKHLDGKRKKEHASSDKKESSSDVHLSVDRRPERSDRKRSKHDIEEIEDGSDKKSDRRDRKHSKHRDSSKESLRKEYTSSKSRSDRHREKSISDSKLTSSKKSLKADSSKHLSVVDSVASSVDRDSGDNSSRSDRRIRVLEDPPSAEVDEDDDGDVDDFVTDPVEHKNSLLGHTVQQMVEVTGEDDDDDDLPEENYDQDDFEDYDDDFEDDQEEEDGGSESGQDTQESEGETERLGELVVAMDVENRRLSSPGWVEMSKELEGEGDSEDDKKHTRSPRHRAFLDFSVVKSVRTDSQTVRKMRTRGKELQEIIELDIVNFDMFDLAPVSEYEVYMRSFGQRDCSQVAVQAGEDTVDTDAQTEEIILQSVWTQHPQEGSTAVGRENDDSVSSESEDVSALMVSDVIGGKDSYRLSAFLTKATQVMCLLMEEECPQDNQQDSTHQQPQGKTALNFSVSYTKLASTYSYLGGRHWKDIVFSPSSNNVLLMMLSSPASPSWSGINSKGILCLWNTREPAKPERVLVTEGSPTCCLLSPSKTPFAFAGMEDGSVEVWDLRSPPLRGLLGAEVDWVGLLPAYSTAHVAGVEGHVAPVRCLCPHNTSSTASYSEPTAESVGSFGLSFQVASLDMAGKLVIWVLAELTNPDPHGSETDFGVAPGGEVKLVKSASGDVCGMNTRSLGTSSIMSVHSLAFHPRDINHYYVGTDMGSVLHCQRYGQRPIPKFYRKDLGHSTNVTAIAFSPWQPDYFLIGCGDGTISLYHHKNEHPLISWTRSTRGRAVEQVLWSSHRPGVFIVLDEASTIHLWDLLECDAAPVNKAEAQNMKIARISLSPLVRDANKQRSLLVLSFEDGSVEIHQLSEQYSIQRENENQIFGDYLFSLVM